MAGTPSGSASGGRNRLIEIEGLKEFRKNLAAMGKEYPKELRAINKKVADEARDLARAKATGMGSVFAKASGKIKSYATQTQASVGFIEQDLANVAFWGTKRRSGWYNWKRYLSNQQTWPDRTAWVGGNHSDKQHPPWIGNTWDVAVLGEGPYAINDALAENEERLKQMYLDDLDEFAKRTGAFPDP